MDDDELSPEDWELVVTVRHDRKWIDSLPALDWTVEMMGLRDGTLRRVWHPNPRYMTYGEPVGWWKTEAVPGLRGSGGQALGRSPVPGASDGTAAAGRYTVQRVSGTDGSGAGGDPAPAEQGTDPAA